VELHPAHEIEGPLDDTEPVSASAKEPWERSAPIALDDSITKAVSLTYPRHINAIVQLVEDDYGSCNLRTVQRRLRALVQRGHLLRIDLGRQLYAYLKPGSALVNDIDLMREQCFDAFASSVPG
jgi:hypothetical protein